MFEALFGTEMPLALRFFIAFVFVLGLIGGAAYLVRRFGAGALSSASARGRQPRLAVIDAAPVDGRRRLVLIRRDNVEHLIMIGGPSDVVVEANIVRAAPAAAAREVPPLRNPNEQMGRQALPPEGSMWPLQPEPAMRPQRATPLDEPMWPAQTPPEPARAPSGDRLAGLAAELSRVATPDMGGVRPLPEPAVARPQTEHARPLPEPVRPAPEYVAARPAPEARPLPEPAPTRSPASESRRPPIAAASPPPPAPSAPAMATPPVAEDQNLADMAHRLEAALRRPVNVTEPAPAEPAMIKPVAEPMVRPNPGDQPPATAPRLPATEAARPAPEHNTPPPDSKHGTKAVYDSLEQEMASLLGRGSGKP